MTAGAALVEGEVSRAEREELGRAIVEEAERLTALVEKLLDLSRLQAGAAEPRRQWCSVEEILRERPTDSIPAARGSASRSTRTCRSCAPTRPSWSGRSRTCSRTRRATPATRGSPCARVWSGEQLMIRVVDRGPGIPARGADADLRAVLPGSGAAGRARRVGPRAGDRARGSSRPTAAGCGRSRCRGRARASSSRCRSSPVRRPSVPRRSSGFHERPAAGARLRRRAAHRARAEDRDARGGLRAAARGDGRGGAAGGDAAAAGRGDPRPRTAGRRRRRGVPGAAGVERHADPRAVRRGGRGPQGAGAGGRRGRLRHQAVQPARAGRAPARGAAPGRAGSRRAGDRGRRPGGRPGRADRSPRRRGGPPDADRVRPAAGARRATAAGC